MFQLLENLRETQEIEEAELSGKMKYEKIIYPTEWESQWQSCKTSPQNVVKMADAFLAKHQEQAKFRKFVVNTTSTGKLENQCFNDFFREYERFIRSYGGKQEGGYGWASTLKEIIVYSIANPDSQSRQICQSFNWLNIDGTAHEGAPTCIKDLVNNISNNKQPTSKTTATNATEQPSSSAVTLSSTTQKSDDRLTVSTTTDTRAISQIPFSTPQKSDDRVAVDLFFQRYGKLAENSFWKNKDREHITLEQIVKHANGENRVLFKNTGADTKKALKSLGINLQDITSNNIPHIRNEILRHRQDGLSTYAAASLTEQKLEPIASAMNLPPQQKRWFDFFSPSPKKKTAGHPSPKAQSTSKHGDPTATTRKPSLDSK